MKINSMKINLSYFSIAIFLTGIVMLSSCAKWGERASSKDIPTNAAERAKKNLKEGRGVSVGSLLSGRR